MRTFTKVGTPKDWVKCGTGYLTDFAIVQRQIRTLKAGKPRQDVEIELKCNGKLLDFNGNVTGKTILLETRK